MRVEVVKSYLWAPDGIRVREVQIGEVLEGEGAEIAMQMGCGRELKAEPAAPANKALGAAPRNKSKG
jgi:hypothetical protein